MLARLEKKRIKQIANNTLPSSFLWIVSKSLQNLRKIIAQIGVY